jgi:hypothetical protein
LQPWSMHSMRSRSLNLFWCLKILNVYLLLCRLENPSMYFLCWPRLLKITNPWPTEWQMDLFLMSPCCFVFQALKHSHKILSQQANDWISSLPNINVMSMPVQALGTCTYLILYFFVSCQLELRWWLLVIKDCWEGISISNQASGDGVAVNEHQELRKMYAEGSNERRQLYNKVLELKGKC